MKNAKVLFLVQLGLLTAIELIFCFTPLGSLPIGPGIVATLSHIPVIVAALLLGMKAGAALGAVFGVSSLIVWTAFPPNPAVAFAFTPFAPNGNIFSLLICLVPRIVFPLVTALVYMKTKDRIKTVPAAALAAVTGSVVHSLLVLSGIFLAFYGSEVVGGNYTTFMVAWGGLNAVMEILVAAIVAAGLIIPLGKIKVK